MTLYCGIDLHSNNHVVVGIDEEDRRIVEKRLSNSLDRTLALLAPYRNDIAGIANELRQLTSSVDSQMGRELPTSVAPCLYWKKYFLHR